MIGLNLGITGRGGTQLTPSLDIDFLAVTAATLDSRITYSRSGMAWRYDTTGVYTTAAHNLVTNSQDFENSAWTKNQCTVTGNVVAEPLAGTVTADLITGTAGTISVTQSVTIPSGARVVVAVYVKPASTNWMRLRINTGAETASQWFNASTGAIGTTTSTASLVLSSPTATSAGSGWYRVSVVVSTVGTTTLSVGVGPTAVDGNVGVSGDSAYIWGYQTEVHTALRSYLITSAKNLWGYSEQFDNAAWSKTNLTVTANAIANPLDGTLTAERVVETAATGAHLVRQNVTLVANTTYTASVYARAGERDVFTLLCNDTALNRSAHFNLTSGTVSTGSTGMTGSASITSVGNGWYRCSVTFTTANAGSGYADVRLSDTSSPPTTGGNYAGDITKGLYLHGGLFSSSGSLDPYVPNIAAAPTSAAFYGARINHDPATLAQRGLLIEEARTNLLLNSANLGVTPWSSNNLSTRLPWAGLAPDGTWSASLIEDASTSVAGYTDQSITVANDSAWYVLSMYVKAGTSDLCHLRIYITGGAPNLGTGVGVNFTFSTATLGAANGIGGQGAASASDVGVTSIGNGWYRLWVRIQNNTSGNTSLTCRIFPQNTSTAAVGNIYAWGAMLESGTFLTSYLPTIPSWTARASTATYHDANGVLQTAASGVARVGYGYNGTSWIRGGPMVELGTTNLQAGDLTNATNWPAISASRAGSVSAPDGTTNAVTITEAVSGTTSYGFNSVTSTITASTACNTSIYAKAGTCSWLRLILCDAVTPTIGIQAWFNVSTGVLGTVSSQASTGGAPSGWAATITNVGSGWYRCTLSGTLATATTGFTLVRLVSGDTATTDTVGGKTMSFFGPQLEVGISPTSYVPTTSASATRNAESATSASATRNADVVTIQPLGSWFNDTQGTVVADFSFPDLFGSINNTVWQIDDGTANNRIFLYGGSTTATTFDIRAGGVQQINILRSSWLTAGGLVKAACAWATNDAQAAFGGTLGTADTVVTVPTGLTTLRLGATSAATQGRMHLRRLQIYNQRVENNTLQTLAT